MTTKKVLRNDWICFSTGEKYDPSESTHGIVYMVIDSETGRIYIGKKQVFKTVKLGKKELALIEKIDKRKKYTKRVETDWRKYPTSNRALRAKIKLSSDRNKDFEFKVLHECYDETSLKFKELEEIILHESFSTNAGYNDNIQIKQIGEIKDLTKRSIKL